ncbi:MAG: VWA domain-containing protein [Clostridia bacterium]|nr:VWA domain-containing protein [Clostridia bacterium]
MKKLKTELVFILDRSGSMSGLEGDTIGGFNSMLEKQTKIEGEARVTTVLFDDRYELLHDRFNLNEVKKLSDEDYFVRGSTALLDAVGITIEKMVNVQKHQSDQNRADKVIFVIITDGMENASRNYNYRMIQQLIKHEEENYGWEFIFLGANIDAEAEAGKIGIRKERAANYNADAIGTKMMYNSMDEAIAESRCGLEFNIKWKEKIEKDHKNRKTDR